MHLAAPGLCTLHSPFRGKALEVVRPATLNAGNMMCVNFGDFSSSEANRLLGAQLPDHRQDEITFPTCNVNQLGPGHGHSTREV